MIVAIASVAFYWVFQGLLIKQVNLFRRSGNELELLYRERYHRTGRNNPSPREELDPIKSHEETELL
jgi:biopolymer transport protein ExbB